MPNDGDPTRSDRSRALPNEHRLTRLGQAIDARTGGPTAPRTRPRSRRRWLRRTLITLGVVIVLIVAGVAADYFYLGSLVNRTPVNSLQSSGQQINILLIGSTTRCGLTTQNKAYGLCSQGITGVNADIDMILHLNTATRQASLLSIPRDLFIPNARVGNNPNKIDAALYNGPSQLVTAIEEDLAIPINHYVELNFDTFASVVDALGGVEMYFPVPIYDAESGLNIERAGCKLLDGYHALQVVRARHLQIQPNPSNHDPHTWPQEGLSDLARIRRTHEFLRVIAAKIASRGLSNPFTDQAIARAVLPDLTVDSGFGEGSMVHLAEEFAHTSISTVPQLHLPRPHRPVGRAPLSGLLLRRRRLPGPAQWRGHRGLDPRDHRGHRLVHRQGPAQPPRRARRDRQRLGQRHRGSPRRAGAPPARLRGDGRDVDHARRAGR